jgi:spermidine synthase
MNLLDSLLSLFKPISFSSKYHKNIRVGYAYGKKTLFTGSVHQSGGEYHYMWKKVFETIKPTKKNIHDCLVLGVGAGTVVPIINNKYPGCLITGVEIDRQMVTVARNYFDLDTMKNLHIMIDDAIHYATSCKKKYDLIVIDLFIGELNPAETRSEQFMKQIFRLLRRSGTVIYNSHFQKDRPQEFLEFKKICSALFQKVTVVFSYPKNKVFVIYLTR